MQTGKTEFVCESDRKGKSNRMEGDRMFSENRKISVRQIRRTLTLEMLGISSLILPGYLAASSRADGVFAMAAGATGAFFLLCLWKRFTKKQNFYQALERCNPLLRVFMSFFYGMALLGISGYVLYVLTRLVQEYLLRDRFEPVILITLTGAAVFGLLRGLESRVRVYEVLFWFLVVPLIVMLCLASVGVNPEYWVPIAASSPVDFARSIYFCFLFFSLSSLFLLFQPHCSQPDCAWKGVKTGLFTVLLLNEIIYLILLGIFQSGVLAQLQFPIITLMAVVKLPGQFLERQDALMIGIWFFCLFALFNSMLYYGKKLLQNTVGGFTKNKPSNGLNIVKKESLWGIFCGLAVLLLAVVFLHTERFATSFFLAYQYVICPLMLLFPVIIFLAGNVGGGRK